MYLVRFGLEVEESRILNLSDKKDSASTVKEKSRVKADLEEDKNIKMLSHWGRDVQEEIVDVWYSERLLEV